MTLRIGLLGASRIAPKAIIGPANRHGDVIISAIAARDGAIAQAYAHEHGIAAAVEGYTDLALRDDVDLIYCALPPAGHLETCLAALRAGKALLVEKPFAMNAEQAQAIATAAGEAGRPALEAFHYRFHSMFERALEIVRDGPLGPLVGAESLFEAQIPRYPGALRWDPAQGGGGMMDLGCYPLHALRTLLGQEPELKSATAELQDGVDVTMDAELMFAGGLPARLRSSMAGERRDWITVEGRRGTLRLDAFVAPQNGGKLTLSTARGEHVETAEGPSTYDAQLAHVVAVMAGEAEPLTGGEDAVANMTIIDAMRRHVGMPVG
ncbi:Gfo/Idh/MocA family protein [Caulobacter sp. S45]|jgi:predicted dehydrogenase|uniref:Gfo/Idh/MocA family protein n=1 Tax=Caulobacter sp. S45 TaxID=1641861 RepID=UPI00131DD7D4|nr:Gfo/Idh/MocA family oxidoreductase [Caulobacter sp. S45]